jgi:hypothetical protein
MEENPGSVPLHGFVPDGGPVVGATVTVVSPPLVPYKTPRVMVAARSRILRRPNTPATTFNFLVDATAAVSMGA